MENFETDVLNVVKTLRLKLLVTKFGFAVTSRRRLSDRTDCKKKKKLKTRPSNERYSIIIEYRSFDIFFFLSTIVRRRIRV